MDEEFVVIRTGSDDRLPSCGPLILKRGPIQACLDFVQETEDPEKPRFLQLAPLPPAPPVVSVDYAELERRVCSHLAGGQEYFYPAFGDPKPPGGADVHLLTAKGNVCIRGKWKDDGSYLGWAPLPKRNKAKEAKL